MRIDRAGATSADNINGFNMANAAFTRVPYVSELYDRNGEFNVGTSTFTAASAGDSWARLPFKFRRLRGLQVPVREVKPAEPEIASSRYERSSSSQ